MQGVWVLLLLFVSFVNTQQPSKCNIPILAENGWLFVDFSFPQKQKILFTSTPNPSTANIPIGQDIGSIWELSEQTNQIKIEFSIPILISSFAINSCTKQNDKSCNFAAKNQIFTFEFQSPNSDTSTLLKPFHFQDGILELSENNGLPTTFVFDQILTDEILVSYCATCTTCTRICINHYVTWLLYQLRRNFQLIQFNDISIFSNDAVLGCTTRNTNSLSNHLHSITYP